MKISVRIFHAPYAYFDDLTELAAYLLKAGVRPPLAFRGTHLTAPGFNDIDYIWIARGEGQEPGAAPLDLVDRQVLLSLLGEKK